MDSSVPERPEHYPDSDVQPTFGDDHRVSPDPACRESTVGDVDLEDDEARPAHLDALLDDHAMAARCRPVETPHDTSDAAWNGIDSSMRTTESSATTAYSAKVPSCVMAVSSLSPR